MVRAHRGMEHLESFKIGLDPTELRAAIDKLTFATEHAGEHADRSFWFYCHTRLYDPTSGNPLSRPAASSPAVPCTRQPGAVATSPAPAERVSDAHSLHRSQSANACYPAGGGPYWLGGAGCWYGGGGG